jgi:hypothetical protein
MTAASSPWSFAGNTVGFGHGINDGRPFWIGNFSRADRAEVLHLRRRQRHLDDAEEPRGGDNVLELRSLFGGLLYDAT